MDAFRLACPAAGKFQIHNLFDFPSGPRSTRRSLPAVDTVYIQGRLVRESQSIAPANSGSLGSHLQRLRTGFEHQQAGLPVSETYAVPSAPTAISLQSAMPPGSR